MCHILLMNDFGVKKIRNRPAGCRCSLCGLVEAEIQRQCRDGGKQKHQSDVLNAADKTARHKSNGDADESQGWGILGQDKGANGKET